MRCIERQVDKERFITVSFNKRQRVVGKIVDDEPIALHDLAVMVERWTEVIPPMSRAEAVILLEAAPIGMVWVLHSVVPLTKRGRRVTSFGEGVTDRALVQVHSFATGGSAIHAAARMIATGEEFGPCRRTDRANIETIKVSTLCRQAIDVRRAEIPVAVKTQVPPSLVVSQNDDDVWPAGLWFLVAENPVEVSQKR